MQSPYQPITEEERGILNSLGLKPYQGRRIPDICNPDCKAYWIANAVVFLGCLGMRKISTLQRGPRMMLSIPVVAIPFAAIADKAKLDDIEGNHYNSHNLDKRMEYSPLTRNAWLEALEENQRFQYALKVKIAELEKELGLVEEKEEEKVEENIDNDDGDEDDED